MNRTTLSANDSNGSATAIRWPFLSSRPLARGPPTSRIAAPSNGSAITSQSRVNTPVSGAGLTTGAVTTPSARRNIESVSPSVLQQARVVDRGRAAGAEDRHDDREPDHDLGRGDHHHEERGDLTVEVAVLL